MEDKNNKYYNNENTEKEQMVEIIQILTYSKHKVSPQEYLEAENEKVATDRINTSQKKQKIITLRKFPPILKHFKNKRNPIKRLIALGIATGTAIAIGNNFSKDEDFIEMTDENKKIISHEVQKNPYEVNEEEKEKFLSFMLAVNNYNKYNGKVEFGTEEEQILNSSKSEIVEYGNSEDFEILCRSIIAKKITDAVKYGEYEEEILFENNDIDYLKDTEQKSGMGFHFGNKIYKTSEGEREKHLSENLCTVVNYINDKIYCDQGNFSKTFEEREDFEKYIVNVGKALQEVLLKEDYMLDKDANIKTVDIREFKDYSLTSIVSEELTLDEFQLIDDELEDRDR